jgi:hypothetical protein
LKRASELEVIQVNIADLKNERTKFESNLEKIWFKKSLNSKFRFILKKGGNDNEAER